MSRSRPNPRNRRSPIGNQKRPRLPAPSPSLAQRIEPFLRHLPTMGSISDLIGNILEHRREVIRLGHERERLQDMSHCRMAEIAAAREAALAEIALRRDRFLAQMELTGENLRALNVRAQDLVEQISAFRALAQDRSAPPESQTLALETAAGLAAALADLARDQARICRQLSDTPRLDHRAEPLRLEGPRR